MSNESLTEVGWNDDVARRWALAEPPESSRPGRVTTVDRRGVQAMTAKGLVRARMARRAQRPDGVGRLPATGDWVAVLTDDGDRHHVVTVLDRVSSLSRRDPAERAVEQVLVANITAVFLVHGLDTPVNPRRLERALALTHESGATPVIVLTKSDLASPHEITAALDECGRSAPGVTVVVLSSQTGSGVGALLPHLGPGASVALLGPSGAGKSSLVNHLLGEQVLATSSVREGDLRGRHTTTSRHLLPLPHGGVIVDTPGIRSIGMWNSAAGVIATFPEVEAAAAACRFTDCRHDTEPGCAVSAAVESDQISADRLDAYRSLISEIEATDQEREAQRWRRGESGPSRRRR